MNLNVVNRGLSVGDIKVTGISSASLFLIGDANQIGSASTFDTPPESLIVGHIEGPLVPLTRET